MLDKIIHFSLSNRILIGIATALILVAGVITVIHTEIDVFPDLNAPTVTVMTEAPGFAPEEVERSVTFPIETALNGATGVRRVRSASSNGFSIVWIEFDWDTDIYIARQIVTEKLSTIAAELPAGIQPPTLGPQSSIMGEMLVIGLTADTTSMQDLRTLADRSLRPHILALGGVSQVSVMGGDVKEYQILLDSEKMKFFDITLDEVLEATQNLNNNVGGGIIYEYGNEYTVKGNISTANVDEIGASVVRSDERGIVLIRDIAEVTIGAETPVLGTASVDAHPAVILTITKQPATDTNDLTQRIEDCLNSVKGTFPSDVKISTNTYRQSRFINNSIRNIESSLIEGAIFVIIILFIFLMNTRTTIISTVALPLSLLIAVLILYFMGLTLNTMSLGGLAIAIGSLVDDAIVDVENVYKRLRENRKLPKAEQKSIIQVVHDASTEVRLPIFNSSLIIIASFLPLFFLSGMEGRLLIPLGIAFIVALLASTLVALTLTPVLCSVLLKHEHENEVKESFTTRTLKAAYTKALTWGLENYKKVLAATAGLFILAVALFFSLGRSFLPPFNEGSFTINVSTMPGMSIDESDKMALEAEKILLDIPEITTVSRKTGRAELAEHSFGANVSEIEAPFELNNGRSKRELENEVRTRLSEIPGVNIEVGQPITHRISHMLSGSESQIAIKIFGDDLAKLYALANQVKTEISKVDGLVDVNVEQQVDRPQIRITPRREIMARYGISIAQFQQLINTALAGNIVSQVYENGLPYNINVRFTDNQRNSIESLKNIVIDSSVGKIPLSEIADIQSLDGPNSINRENVSRRIIISANVDGRDLKGAVDDVKSSIESNIKFPENYYVVYGGQFESEASASRTLALASIGALLLIFTILYYEFKNVSQSLIIMINLPLSMIGGIFILTLTSGELNIPSIIGFISLLGISTRNGMLLISRYNHLAEEKMPLLQRVMTGSVDRLSPIIMTALTSALAMIPIALKAAQPGNEIQSPLAIVILGGLLSSTLLNIFVVPIFYYLTNKE